MPLHTNSDGTLRPFTTEEVEAMGIQTADVRDGSHPVHKRDGKAGSILRPFYCYWDQLENFIGYMLGGSVTYRDGGGTLQLSRLMPQTFPGLPQFAAVGVEDARGARGPGIDDGNRVPGYPYAKVVIRYESVPFLMVTDALAAGNPEYGRYAWSLPSRTDVRYLDLPGNCLNYIREDGTAPKTPMPHLVPIPRNVGFPEAEQVVRWRWHRLPYECWGAGTPLYTRVYGDIANGVRPFTGTVNSNLLFGRPPGQLLYLGCDEEWGPDPVTGLKVWDLTHVWLSRPVDHNRLFWMDSVQNAGTGGYYFAARGSTYYTADTLEGHDGVALFDAKNHDYLWQVG